MKPSNDTLRILYKDIKTAPSYTHTITHTQTHVYNRTKKRISNGVKMKK